MQDSLGATVQAFKIAYDGKMFTGSARQPEHRTVEGTLIEALKTLGAMDVKGEGTFRSASRTDRGVSALGNVFIFDSKMKGSDVVKAMNGTYAQEGLWFMGWTEVPEDFKPRHAKVRWYRYVLPVQALQRFDLTAMRKAAKLFVGPHDFSSFCKDDKSLATPRSTLRSLESVELDTFALALGSAEDIEKGKWTGHKALHPGRLDLIVVDIKGQSFLWQMVRRIVSAMVSVAKGKASLEDLKDALDGNPHVFGVLPSEGLTLMDVQYDVEFTPAEGTEHLREALETEVLWDLARDLVFHQHLQKKLLG
jgi:tRNA pseudouridine38-40 synthase